MRRFVRDVGLRCKCGSRAAVALHASTMASTMAAHAADESTLDHEEGRVVVGPRVVY